LVKANEGKSPEKKGLKLSVLQIHNAIQHVEGKLSEVTWAQLQAGDEGKPSGASEEEVAQLQAELEHEREKTKTSSMQHAALLETFEAEIATTRELLQEKEREGQRQLTAEIEAHKRTAERLAQAEATDTRRSDLPDMAVGVTHP